MKSLDDKIGLVYRRKIDESLKNDIRYSRPTGDYYVTVPEDIWNLIMKILDKTLPPYPKKNGKKTRRL